MTDVNASDTDPDPPPVNRRRRGATLFASGGMFSSLRIYQFRILWFGMLFSMAAMQMNMVARSWLAYDITGSGVAIGLVALSMGAPRFFIAPIGGVAADRFDKRTLLAVTQTVRVGMALAVAVLVTMNLIELWHLLAVGVFHGLSASFMAPARTAFISDLVDDDELPNAIALDATGRNLNRVVAPAIAGMLIWLTPALVFYVIAVFYILGTLSILRLPAAGPADASSDSMFRDAARGFAYTWSHRPLLLLLGLSITVVLLGMPFRQLLPVFQKDVFDVGPSALGIMYTAVGIGAILASLLVAYLSDSSKKQQILLVSGIGFGLSLSLFAISGSYLVALGLLTIVGFASQVFLTMNKTMLMIASDRAYYGRIMSIYMMGFSLMPIALLPMGTAVDAVGAPTTIAAAGVAIISIIAATGTIQSIRNRSSRALLVPSETN
ncbi:MFS transporter [soil metagenome]